MNLKFLLTLTVWVINACCANATDYWWDSSDWHEWAAMDADIVPMELEGNNYLCAMRGTDFAAGIQLGDPRRPPSAQSIFVEKKWSQALSSWYWFSHPPRTTDPNSLLTGWAPFFEIMDIPPEGWKFERLKHENTDPQIPFVDQRYRAGSYDGTAKHRFMNRYATGAEIDFMFNRDGGVVIVHYFQNPYHAAKKYWLPDDAQRPERRIPDTIYLPHLSQLSDFVYMTWRYTFEYIPELRFFGFTWVSDKEVFGILARILILRGLPDLEYWPAANSVVQIDTPEGRAMLATALGKNVAFLLVQHKAGLGRMQIMNFRFFRGPTQDRVGYPNIIFELGLVPADKINNDMPALPTPYPEPLFPPAR